MIELKIDFDFCEEVGIRLSWSEVLHGLDRHILANDFAIDQARFTLQVDSVDDHLNVAIGESGEAIRERVEKLAALDQTPPNLSKIIYLILVYIDKHVGDKQKKLGLLEDVYCEFEYPNELSSFIRYMPMDGPDLGSREANEERMIQKFKSYLNDSAVLFSSRGNQGP